MTRLQSAPVWLALSAVAVVMATSDWLDPNWRHQLSNQVIGYVVLSLLGGIFLVAWFGMRQIPKLSLALAMALSASIFALVGAGVGGIVWLVSHRAAQDDQQSASRAQPQAESQPAGQPITGTIDQVLAGDFTPVGAQKPTMATTMLAVTLRNTGEPTAVDGYKLFLVYPNGTLADGQRMSLPSHMTIGYGDGQQETIYGHDALDRKTMQPIPTGGMAQGRLLYGFPGITADFIKGHGEGLRLMIRDASHREYQIDHKFKSLPFEKPTMKGFPGMTPPTNQ